MDFFILNSKRVLNSVDFSPFTKAQNDNALPFLQVDFSLSNESSKWQKQAKSKVCCHTEALAEVSTNLKHEFVLLKYGFFILHLKRILNFMDFSLRSKWQCRFFAFCESSKWQNPCYTFKFVIPSASEVTPSTPYRHRITTPSPLQKRHKVSNFPRVA